MNPDSKNDPTSDQYFGGFKSGFITLAGAPNVGKSTLLNRMLGQKIAITSRKAQTTRNRILGVVHRPQSQMIFLDTPGMHSAKKELNVRMVDAAVSAINESDVIVFMTDLTGADPASEDLVVEKIAARRRPALLALNKTDLVKPGKVLESIDRWRSAYPFEALVPVSAKTGDGVDVLLDEMERRLPPGPPYFPEDTLTDIPERFIAAEMVREKVFRLTGQEIPYAAAVTVDKYEESRKIVNIYATIHVERNSQKGIVIGKGGSMLRRIGEAARTDIEKMVGGKVFLKLFVRVQKNWSRDTKALRKFGYS